MDANFHLAKATSLALSKKYLDAAWEIWDLYPEWAARLLKVDTPYCENGDYWKECCAWDNIPDTPPDVILEMQGVFDGRHRHKRERKRLNAYLHRCRKRDLKATFRV